MTAHAQEGFYDPTNKASPTGKTVGHEQFKTIGCPGRGLLDKQCVAPPPDSDGDGVVDPKDKCPGTPAGRKVNADGCELDTDGDGLVDGVDKCPTVYAKTADGCPLPVATPAPTPAPAPKKLELTGVNFEYDKAVLRQEDMPILDNAAAQLGEWGNVKVEVAGHTDDRGSDDYNNALSQQRADAVRDYLISKGIAADRLTAKGYGEAQPVADNGSDEGRAKNRRVELVPQQ
jgi:OOP family OmpA-OmpF porin